MALAKDNSKNSAPPNSMGGGQPSPQRLLPQAGPDPHFERGAFCLPLLPDGDAGWALEGGPRARLCILRQGKLGAPGCSPSARQATALGKGA